MTGSRRFPVAGKRLLPKNGAFQTPFFGKRQAALSALPGLFAACEFACVVTAMRVSEHEDMSGISEAMGGVKRAIRGMAGGAGGIREFLFLVSLAEGERKASFDIILAGRPAA